MKDKKEIVVTGIEIYFTGTREVVNDALEELGEDLSVMAERGTGLKVDIKDLIEFDNTTEDEEICEECGRSVAWGSGLFVDRVPDADDFETRRQRGVPHPVGGWICRECEEKIQQEIDMETQEEQKIWV